MKFDSSRDTAATSHHLLVACPNDGGLVALGPGGGTVLDFFDTTGLFADIRRIVRGYQTFQGCHIDLFEDGRHRALFLPESIDTHDVFLDGDTLYTVSTGTNEILAFDLSGHLLERIAYPGGEDSHHLNCIGRVGGRLVVSAFGAFSRREGWRNGMSKGRGLILELRDTTSARPLMRDLDQPHTPREHGGQVYVCDSRNNRLLRQSPGLIGNLDFPGWFTRGLAFADDTLYVGLSTSRNNLTEHHKAGIAVVDLPSFSVRKIIPLPFAEIYDIVAVSPTAHTSICEHYQSLSASAWLYARQSISSSEAAFRRTCETAQVFWSECKAFDAKNSIRRRYAKDHVTRLVFNVPVRSGITRIRIDPAESAGEFSIRELVVEEIETGRILWRFDQSAAASREITESSNVVRLSPQDRARFACGNSDPQLFVPPLQHTGPLSVVVDFDFSPSLGPFPPAHYDASLAHRFNHWLQACPLVSRS